VNRLLAIAGGRLHFVYDALHGYAVDGISVAGVDKVRADPAVAYVEPDMVVHPDNAQSDPGIGLDRIDQHYLPLDSTFTYAGSYDGSGVNVYIIDSGVDTTGGEFAGRIGVGKTCVQGDAYANNDGFGHGTAVASVAAGTTFGVAKSATIHSVRISIGFGGYSQTSIQTCGINWVASYGVRPAVANMSFGGIPSAFAVRDAINNVTGAGIPFVKSAGNDSANAYLDRGNRANLELVVGATDPTNDTYASFSDSGSTINIWAPGVQVSMADQFNPGYGKKANGTSFSAPYVSGFIAALLSKYPTMSSSAVYSQVLNGSTQNVIVGLPSGNNNRLLYAVVP